MVKNIYVLRKRIKGRLNKFCKAKLWKITFKYLLHRIYNNKIHIQTGHHLLVYKRNGFTEMNINRDNNDSFNSYSLIYLFLSTR